MVRTFSRVLWGAVAVLGVVACAPSALEAPSSEKEPLARDEAVRGLREIIDHHEDRYAKLVTKYEALSFPAQYCLQQGFEVAHVLGKLDPVDGVNDEYLVVEYQDGERTLCDALAWKLFYNESELLWTKRSEDPKESVALAADGTPIPFGSTPRFSDWKVERRLAEALKDFKFK